MCAPNDLSPAPEPAAGHKLYQSAFIAIIAGPDATLFTRFQFTLLNSGVALVGCEYSFKLVCTGACVHATSCAATCMRRVWAAAVQPSLGAPSRLTTDC